jgi:single-stranded-DNA-specific exonuclease
MAEQGSADNNIRYRRADLSKCQFDDDMPILLQRIYAARGVNTQRELNLSLHELPPPDGLQGLDKALNLLVEALVGNLSIVIIGDFDADGATSTTLALLALRSMACQRVNFLVPDRFLYGYGLTPKIVALAAEDKPDLLITVDNGISSHEGVNAAKALGIRVLITDHHLPGEDLPLADAIINPNQHECQFPDKNIAGVGVIFYLMSALRGRLEDIGYFRDSGLEPPNMARWLDLVALGTVADVVPLSKVNRVLVGQGIARMRSGHMRPGILALLELANRQPRRLVASDLGFSVAPRLNAAGRLEDMTIGINCLLTESPAEARKLANKLDELNLDRRSIETDMERKALTIANDLRLDSDGMPWGLCLMDSGWHQGVVGLVASRLKDKYHRPVIAFAPASTPTAGPIFSEDSLVPIYTGELKGSARSIPGLHIRDVLAAIATENPGLLGRFGGHAMAAGLSLPAANYSDFALAFDEQVRRLLSIDDLKEETLTDGELTGKDLNLAFAECLRNSGPWGQHFPEPSFYGEFNVVAHRIVADRHVKLTLSPFDNKYQYLDGIAFGMVEKHDVKNMPERLAMVYRLDVNEFRGSRSVQLMVDKLLLPQIE